MTTDIVQQFPLLSNEPDTITIQLTKGQQTVISAIDADLADFKWTTLSARDGVYYAYRMSAMPNRTAVLLHRVILERVTGRPLARTEFVDHIDGNRLDNRRANLRVATKSENGRNRGRQRNNTSGFKGVTWEKERGKWVAAIMVGGKQAKLGRFDTPEEAYAAYCTAARELHGKFANTGER